LLEYSRGERQQNGFMVVGNSQKFLKIFHRTMGRGRGRNLKRKSVGGQLEKKIWGPEP